MYLYAIYNKVTLEEIDVQGHSFEDACRKHGLNPKEWTVLGREYVD